MPHSNHQWTISPETYDPHAGSHIATCKRCGQQGETIATTPADIEAVDYLNGDGPILTVCS